jgi:hypothetical protein
VTEGIAEPSLAMHAPRRFVIPNRIRSTVCTACDRALDKHVGIVDEHFDSCRGFRPTGADEIGSRLMKKDSCPVNRESDDASEIPQLDRAKGTPVPVRGDGGIIDRQHH